MNNTLIFLKLHIKTGWILYLFPVFYLYCFLLPYQGQFLSGDIDEDAVRNVMDSAQEMLLFMGIWYQYLGFRILLSSELREISYGNEIKSKIEWEICCIGLFFVIMLPYLSWLVFRMKGYEICVKTLVFQCIIMQLFVYCLIHICRSPLAGLVAAAAYYFFNINQLLPSYISIARIGVLQMYYTVEWYIVQIGFAILFFSSTIFLEKMRYVSMKKG